MAERDARWREVSAEWNQLGDTFATLGRSLKQSYEQERDDDSATARTREVREAFERALQSFADAIDAGTDAIRAPEVKQTARASASALGDALNRTLDAVAQEINEAVEARRRSGDDTGSG
jgi:hypothetical protein